MTSASNKKVLSSGVGKLPPKSWARNYWELARMHKFPAGSTHLFWPAGKGNKNFGLFKLSIMSYSVGLYPRRTR